MTDILIVLWCVHVRASSGTISVKCFNDSRNCGKGCDDSARVDGCIMRHVVENSA
jgi:hypothetical protein